MDNRSLSTIRDEESLRRFLISVVCGLSSVVYLEYYASP